LGEERLFLLKFADFSAQTGGLEKHFDIEHRISGIRFFGRARGLDGRSPN
jgi:hypothetical protein